MNELIHEKNKIKKLSNGIESVQKPLVNGTVHKADNATKIIINTTKVSSSCSGIMYPGSLAKSDTWYSADNAKNMYIFSAYHDERSRTFITLIGVIANLHSNSYKCQLWYNTPDIDVRMKEVPASVNVYGEVHGRKYTTCNFKCTLPNSNRFTRKSPQNLLLVKESKQKPFNTRYGRAYELVEWIEFRRILGAEHFIIYNYSSAINVVKLLDEYIKQGFVEVIQWPLPMNVKQRPPTKATVEIHGFGLIAAVNDCLLRIREQSRYLVFVDVDEYIIPHSPKSSSWKDMLTELLHQDAYYFSNVFFRKEWNSSEPLSSQREMAEKYILVTLLKTEKEKNIWIPPERSKYIARRDSVQDLGNHHVSKMKRSP